MTTVPIAADITNFTFGVIASLLLVISIASSPAAQADTIDTLKQRKVIYLGVRADQPPFSTIGADGAPTGYMVALCGEIVQALRDSQNMPALAIKYVTVSADSRFDDLAAKRVDLLCEGTSMTVQRMQSVDFSLETWISGIGVMTRSDSTIGNIKDLEGHRVGVVGNTATESMVRASLQQLLVTADIITFSTHVSATKALLDKNIDAYFGDRTTLTVLRQQSKDAAKLKIADQDLSLEPYAMALRRDDDRLRVIVNMTLARLYRSGKIQEIFRTYLPDAEPSPLLKAMFVLQSVPEL